MCCELFEALVTSESSTRDTYEREGGERHGGTHEKEVVALFGPVGPVPRAYFHKKEADGTKRGHYPWDERMGLLRQYTPAVVSEVLRLAAIHTYEEAAQEFEKAHGFRISPDAMSEIVRASSADAAKFHQMCESVRQESRCSLAYVLVDGTGISCSRGTSRASRGRTASRPRRARSSSLHSSRAR